MGELAKIVVVVPTYNERENLPVLAGLLSDLNLPGLELLVVDDNSPDGTGDVADELAKKSPDKVGVLHRTVKDGLGRAYVAGITRALDEGADIVIQMDADLSHPASVIPTMVEILRTTDAGVVIGSRYVPGGAGPGGWGGRRPGRSARAHI
jgi:dolichol-phosphate mannosyltransferase